MALVPPNALYPGITVDATTVHIPLADLGGLTQSEADPVTGNAAKVLYELLYQSSIRYAALADAAKSARMTFIQGNLSTSGAGNVVRPFTANFTLQVPSTADVAAEP